MTKDCAPYRKSLAVAAAAVVLSCMTAGLVRGAGEEARPLVAVVDFQIEGVLERTRPKLGVESAEGLRKRLSPSAYRTMTRDQILAALEQDNLAVVDLWAEAELAYTFAERTGVRYVILGRIVERRREWRVYARLVDCAKQKAGREQVVTVKENELTEVVLNRIVAALALEVAPPADDEAAEGQRLPKQKMRVIQARLVRAAPLYLHVGGWEFGSVKPAVEVTVGLDARELAGRKLTGLERGALQNAQIGNSLAEVDHNDFRLIGRSDQGDTSPGNFHPGYRATTRVRNQYLLGYRRVGGALRVAWQCMDLTRRRCFYNSSCPEVIVPIVFPEAKPGAVAKIQFKDWDPVDVKHVVEPLLRALAKDVPRSATMVLTLKDVEASNVYYQTAGWTVGPLRPALEVAVVLKVNYMNLRDLSVDEKLDIDPMPAGDWAAEIDPDDFSLRTLGGRTVPAKANWMMGLEPGTRLKAIVQNGTDATATLWRSVDNFKRIYYAETPDSAIQVTVVFPGVKANDVAQVRYKNWSAVKP